MKKILSLSVLLSSAMTILGQTVTLTFTGRDAASHFIQLNRVVIANATQSWQETIYYPDTTLIMGQVGIEDYESDNVFKLQQNNPNPFEGITYATLRTVEPGDAVMELADVNGRIVETQNFASLQMGTHRFRIEVSAVGIYFLTVRQNGQSSSIKMMNTGSCAANKIEYWDWVNTPSVGTRCITSLQKNNANNKAKGTTTHPFALGDQMEYVGYAIVNGTEIESQHILQPQSASQTITLQFDAGAPVDGVPCPNTLTVTDYDNNTYNTVKIGQQCWMKENLRTTHYSDGAEIHLSSNASFDVAYRYYPNNDSNNVTTYGYLYNWKAVMRNASSSSSNPSGVQGICPTGWHVPSVAEWTQLTDYVSSQSQYLCDNDINNIAKALASTTGWESNSDPCVVGNNQNSNNATGFTAVPAGTSYGSSYDFGYFAYFWSATQDGSLNAYYRDLNYFTASVDGFSLDKLYGYSVRCIRN